MLWAATLVLAQITDYSALARQNPHTSAADVSRGQRTFMGQCAGCHGPRGEGAKGPPLNRGAFEHARTDFELFRVIRGGIAGTEMPSAIQISDKEIWQTISFVRTFAGAAGTSAKGSATAGEALYFGKGGCAGCHLNRAGRVAGRAFGPDLSEIGLRRSPAHLRTSLTDPAADLPDGFLLVNFQHQGRQMQALRLNEDTFSVRLQQFDGAVRSFWKRDLQKYEQQWGKTPMPSYTGKLTDGELDDLVAYLAALRGAR